HAPRVNDIGAYELPRVRLLAIISICPVYIHFIDTLTHVRPPVVLVRHCMPSWCPSPHFRPQRASCVRIVSERGAQEDVTAGDRGRTRPAAPATAAGSLRACPAAGPVR